MTVPCADPANNPDDWFLEKDGKQYPDDPSPVTDAEVALYVTNCEAVGLPMDALAAREALEALATQEAIRRRRHAKDKCHVECYFRLACLSQALDGPGGIEYGTRGGYYPEELKKIAQLRHERQLKVVRKDE